VKSNRLQGFDYSSEGAYFITVCTALHICEFGDIIDGKMVLNMYGEIVKEEWYKSEEIRKELSFGEFCLMPNHIHGIVFIHQPIISLSKQKRIQTSDYKNTFGPQFKSLSTFINRFKGSCTRLIRANGNRSFTWQRNFHDHIIRDQQGLNEIENYIKNNAANWDDDRFFC